jgi:predicted MFS family arabinose efflux permease
MRLDPAGVAIVTVALGLVVYPLVEGQQLGWPSWIWVMLGCSPIVFAVFVAHQLRRATTVGSPLVPMSLFRHRGFSAGVVTQFLFFGAMVGFSLILTLYLQLGLHFTAIAAGLVLLPFSLAAFVGSGIAVALAARAGKPLVFLGAVLQAGAILAARHIIDTTGSALGQWALWMPMAVAGLGLGLLVIPLADLALATVDPADAGAGSGVFNTFQQVGGALGIAIAGVVFFRDAGAVSTPDTLRAALLAAAWVPICGHALAAVGSLLLPRSSLGAAHAAAELGEAPSS